MESTASVMRTPGCAGEEIAPFLRRRARGMGGVAHLQGVWSERRPSRVAKRLADLGRRPRGPCCPAWGGAVMDAPTPGLPGQPRHDPSHRNGCPTRPGRRVLAWLSNRRYSATSLARGGRACTTRHRRRMLARLSSRRYSATSRAKATGARGARSSHASAPAATALRKNARNR